jgi:hypothetical protein
MAGTYFGLADLERLVVSTRQVAVAAFRRAVAEGEGQLDRGEGAEYSRDLMNKLADTARKNTGSGKPIDPDVAP